MTLPVAEVRFPPYTVECSACGESFDAAFHRLRDRLRDEEMRPRLEQWIVEHVDRHAPADKGATCLCFA